MEAESLAHVLSKRPQLPKHIVSGGVLVENTKAVLYGNFKSGKSTFLQYLGLCIAGGLPLFNTERFSTVKSKVFYIQMEMPYLTFIQRLRGSSLSNLQEVQENFYTLTKFWMKLDRDEGIKKLGEELSELRPNVLIIDPGYKCLSGSENSVEDLNMFFDRIDVLMERFRFSVIMTFQGRKTQTLPTGEPRDLGDEEMRGSTAIGGWADSIMGLRRIGEKLDDTRRRISFTLRHGVGERYSFSEIIDYNVIKGLYSIV